MDQEKVIEVLVWVRDHSTHSQGCPALHSARVVCTCGWAAAQAALAWVDLPFGS